MKKVHNIGIRRPLSWGCLVALAVALGAWLPRGAPARAAYAATRAVVSFYTVHGYPGYLTMSGKNAVVRYRPGEAADAALVMAGVDKYYARVMADFGVRPKGPVPVVVYPTASSLNRSLGWAGDLNAEGAYWAGVIRVLAPSAWIEAGGGIIEKDIFLDEGPMAHELTHLAVDLRTGGNAPRWLQEGLAQWEEQRLTGARPPELSGGTWYSLADLTTRFDSLTDQRAAYYQSWAAVTYMYDAFGWQAVDGLLTRLGEGEPVGLALTGALGEDPARFAAAYRRFAAGDPD